MWSARFVDPLASAFLVLASAASSDFFFSASFFILLSSATFFFISSIFFLASSISLFCLILSSSSFFAFSKFRNQRSLVQFLQIAQIFQMILWSINYSFSKTIDREDLLNEEVFSVFLPLLERPLVAVFVSAASFPFIF